MIAVVVVDRIAYVTHMPGGSRIHFGPEFFLDVEESVGAIDTLIHSEDEDDDEEGEWDEADAVTTQFVEQYKANVAHLTAGATPEDMARIREDIVRDKVAAYKDRLMDNCGMSEEDAEKCMALMERILSPENIPRPKGFE